MTDEGRMDAWNQMWRNFCVNDTYEPGSPAKPMTVAAGLEEGVIGQNDTFLCDGGQDVGGYRIKCVQYLWTRNPDLRAVLNEILQRCHDADRGETREYSGLQNIRNYSAWVRRPESIFRERHMD